MKTKRAILTTLLLTLFVLAFSQVQLVYETNNHLEFNGMSLNGDLNVFVAKLQKQGFTIKTTSQDLVIFNAELIGKPCEMAVLGTKKTKTVYRVTILLPE